MVDPAFEFRSHTLICYGNSKFLGNPTGAAAVPQQSRLSFGKPKSQEGVGKTKSPDSRSSEHNDEFKHIKNEDEIGDVKTSHSTENSDCEGTPAVMNGTKQDDHKGINLNQAGVHLRHDSPQSPKRRLAELKAEESSDEDDDEPLLKRPRRGRSPKQSPKASKSMKAAQPAKTNAQDDDGPSLTGCKEKISSKHTTKPKKGAKTKLSKPTENDDEDMDEGSVEEQEHEDAESDEDEKPEVAAKTREKVQSTLQSSGKDPYPDWKPGEPVPYAALCTTFSLIEMTTKRLAISAHCSLFLRQVLRLTPHDLLPTIQLMINKLAADYAGIELGIGESLIMKAIGETTGRSLPVIKADQNEIGDLGLVAAKSRGNQPTMFKPKPLTVRAVLDGLMSIATTSGGGSQALKVAGIKKLLSAADASKAGKGIDITKDKGGPSEAKFIIRFLEGKLRLGLAERTVLVAIAHAMVMHETAQKGEKVPTSERLAQGEATLKTVYRYAVSTRTWSIALTIE